MKVKVLILLAWLLASGAAQASVLVGSMSQHALLDKPELPVTFTFAAYTTTIYRAAIFEINWQPEDVGTVFMDGYSAELADILSQPDVVLSPHIESGPFHAYPWGTVIPDQFAADLLVEDLDDYNITEIHARLDLLDLNPFGQGPAAWTVLIYGEPLAVPEPSAWVSVLCILIATRRWR